MEKPKKVPAAQTSPIIWGLRWETAQLCSLLPLPLVGPDPAPPVPVMLVLGAGWGQSPCPGPCAGGSAQWFLPQKSCQSHTGAAALAGNHLHAVLRQPGGG